MAGYPEFAPRVATASRSPCARTLEQWSSPTPRSPTRWRSSATCTSSTGRSSTACSPTATPRRRCARRPVSVAALARAGRATELPGIGATLEQKIRRAARHRHDPRGGEAARAVPAGPDRDHAAARARAQARAAAVRRARDRLAAGAARGRARAARCARVKGLGAEVRGKRARGARAGAAEPPERAARTAAAAARARAGRDARARACASGAAAGTHVSSPGSARRHGRQREGHRPDRRHDASPTTLAKSLARLPEIEQRLLRRRRPGARARTHSGVVRRAADRGARAARQPAPALHRLRARTTRRCAKRRCEADCTCPSTACSTTRPARPDTARPRRSSTSCSGLAYIEPELRENRGELAGGRRRDAAAS